MPFLDLHIRHLKPFGCRACCNMEHVATRDPDVLALLIVQQYLQEQGFAAGGHELSA